MSKTTIKEKDRGWKRFIVKTKGRPSVAIGIQGEKGNQDRDGLTNVMLGTIHEFGTANIPERSFLRSTFDENYKKYIQEYNALFTKAIASGDLKGNLMLLGEKVRSDVLKKIKSKLQPALSAATIAKKGGEDTPLIDTGQMWNAISVEVRD